MQGLLGGFLSPEAGQARRAWLNEQDQRIDGVLSYFLGPQLMPRVRGAVGAANELTDFADYRDAVLGADQMATGATTADRIAGAGTMATGLAAMMVPGVSARMAEGATDVAGDLARFIADEDGGIRVWHGSPHDFDKFSMDKIGTGEGAQAYGHGLYFAENEGVARAYQQALQQVSTAPADEIGIPPGQWNAFRMFAQTMDTTQPEAAARDFAQWTGRDVTDDLVEAFRRAKSPGRLYEVDLHANPEDFLDWDAPLPMDSSLRRVLEDRARAFLDVGNGETRNAAKRAILSAQNADMTGAGVQHQLSMIGNIEGAIGEHLGPLSPPMKTGPGWASERMRDAGIPGIRYLDQGSRGAGDGTRNYVVFDENIIEIVKKYGIAGAAAMLGLSAADVEAQVAQQGSGGGW